MKKRRHNFWRIAFCVPKTHWATYKSVVYFLEPIAVRLFNASIICIIIRCAGLCTKVYFIFRMNTRSKDDDEGEDDVRSKYDLDTKERAIRAVWSIFFVCVTQHWSVGKSLRQHKISLSACVCVCVLCAVEKSLRSVEPYKNLRRKNLMMYFSSYHFSGDDSHLTDAITSCNVARSQKWVLQI